MAIFQGIRINDVCSVSVDGHPLSPRWSQSIRNHSPDGFNWGYCGSGPAQLALALLLEVFTVPMARLAYQSFKRSVVAGWNKDRWTCTTEGIEKWVQAWYEKNKDRVQEEEEVADEG
jgi:Family of unknown function (DUF6166)